ncbi:MAG: YqeG family HAD IIIA-type phosphatase [Pelosinus sp.]|nr:YqeG family HAD IIIA-type phosphatase [Pelosinus sp.]
MYKLLCPDQVADSIGEIDIVSLADKGFKGVIIDLDNTIIPWAGSAMQPEIIQQLMHFRTQGFKMCLLSNNRPRRVQEIAASLGIPFVSKATKPLKRGFRQALELLKLPENQTVVIGDQLFTDVLGGNRLGMYTIWVMPLSTEEFIMTKAVRCLERIARAVLKINMDKSKDGR